MTALLWFEEATERFVSLTGMMQTEITAIALRVMRLIHLPFQDGTISQCWRREVGPIFILMENL